MASEPPRTYPRQLYECKKMPRAKKQKRHAWADECPYDTPDEEMSCSDDVFETECEIIEPTPAEPPEVIVIDEAEAEAETVDDWTVDRRFCLGADEERRVVEAYGDPTPGPYPWTQSLPPIPRIYI
jgi:hypothetical protein